MKEYFIDHNTEGQRLDRYLSEELEDRFEILYTEINQRGICESQSEACKIQLQAFF